MHWRWKLVVTFLLLTSCGANDKATTNHVDRPADAAAVKNEGYLQVAGDSVTIPTFSVELHLSDSANQKLLQTGESIIVAAWFSGTPTDTTGPEFSETGELFLTASQIELTDSNRTASFSHLRFARTAYDSLANKDIRVLINVFSGRRSSPDNLLDCGILADSMSNVINKKIVLSGKLIGEAGDAQF